LLRSAQTLPSPFPIPLRNIRCITFITINFPLKIWQTDLMSAAMQQL